eukprot:452419_1
MNGYMEGFLLPCARCHQMVEPEFFCPVEHRQARHIQEKNSQWCLECIGKTINKYACAECFDFFPKSGFFANEFMKGRKRECKKCSSGPAPGLRDSNLLFKKSFECWNCKKKMTDNKKYTCKKCQRPTYCSKSCQKVYWIKHRDECEKQNQIAQRIGLLKKPKNKNDNNKNANKKDIKQLKSNPGKRCKICNVSVPEFQWMSHINGKKHQKKLKSRKW